MEQEPLSQGNFTPPAEQQPNFVPPGELEANFTPPGELQPNFAPDAVLSEGPVPTPAELVLQPGLLPEGDIVTSETPAVAPLPEIKDLEDPQERPFKLIDVVQAQFSKVRSQIEEHGESPKHPEYVKALTAQTKKLVGLLLSEEVQAAPEKVSLNRDGYELLANHFNKGEIPTFDELVGLRNIIGAKDPANILEDPNLSDEAKAKIQGHIDDVQEKSQAEYWLISDEQRSWYERVADAPSLSPYKAPTPAPRNTRQKLFDRVAPSGSKQRKSFYKKISPPRHPDPRNRASPAPDASKYLSKDEILRVKKEFWNNNPRQEQNPHKRVNKNTTAIIAAARFESNARVQLDSKIRQSKAEFEAEVETEKAMADKVRRYAIVANQLGRLGVRDEDDQTMFEVTEEYIRSYNEELLSRGDSKAVIAAGVKPVSSRDVKAEKSAATKTGFRKLR